MREDAYRKRLAADLARWEAAGWIDAAGRAAIAAEGETATARLSAAGALAVAGACLLGAAVVAVVMANWAGLPRPAQTGLVIAALWAALAGAALAGPGRPWAVQALTALAALVFAAGVGVVGQIYNMPGEPAGALALAAAGGLVIAAAAGRAGAAYPAVAFALAAAAAAPGVATPAAWFGGHAGAFGLSDGLYLAFLAAAGAVAAGCRARVLGHVVAALGALAALRLAVWAVDPPLGYGLAAAGFGALALAAASRAVPARRSTLGYGLGFGLLAFALAGYDGGEGWGLAHRAAWLALAVGTIALGRALRHGWAAAIGIVAALAAAAALLADLGLALTTAAGVFAGLAGLALLAAWLLGRRRRLEA